MSHRISRLLQKITSSLSCEHSTGCQRHISVPNYGHIKHGNQLTKYGHHVMRLLSTYHLPRDFPESLSTLPKIEQIVDSPVTFLGIEYLQNDEIFYLLEHIQKLIGTKHPIVEFGAQTLLGSTGTFKIHGLIVLLLAQITNSGSTSSRLTRDSVGILPKQRRLVEVCEMISTAFFLHDNIVNVNDKQPNLQKGNKLSLLFGDYFLATACSQLATMENPAVVDSVSKAISSNVEGRFWLETIEPSDPPSVNDLSYYCSLRHGALMASCCYSTALLSGLDEGTAKTYKALGEHIGQAIHLKKEIFVTEMNNIIGPESLSSYPFIAAVQMLNKSGQRGIVDKTGRLNEEDVRRVINLGHGLRLTSEQCDMHCSKALDSLQKLDIDESITLNLAAIINDIRSSKPIFTA